MIRRANRGAEWQGSHCQMAVQRQPAHPAQNPCPQAQYPSVGSNAQ
jgi:hypothetical protein